MGPIESQSSKQFTTLLENNTTKAAPQGIRTHLPNESQQKKTVWIFSIDFYKSI
jgi:hypothetical protein